MGRESSAHVVRRNAFRVLGGKPDGKRPLTN
jgi:hypothetical protein